MKESKIEVQKRFIYYSDFTPLLDITRKKEANRRYYLKNYDKIQSYRRSEAHKLKKKIWLKKHPGYYKEYGKLYREKNREKRLIDGKRYYQENYDKIKEYRIKHWQEFRLKILSIVGKGQVYCVKCGCSDTRLLEINHINGGGTREIKGHSRFYTGIIKGIRKVDDLEIRCRVCNSLHYLELKYGKLPYIVSYNKKRRVSAP